MERRTPPARDTSSMMTSNESRSECKFISYTLCTFGDAAINKDRLLHTRDICIDRIALHAGNPRRDMMVNIVGKYDVSGLHTINIFVYTFNDRHCLAALCYYCYHLQPFFIYLLNIQRVYSIIIPALNFIIGLAISCRNKEWSSFMNYAKL